MSIWKNCHVFLLLLLLSVVTSNADILTLIDSTEPQPDLQATPCRLASFDQSSLSSPSQKYVLIQEPATPSSVVNFNDFIQSLAQYLSPFGYKVCTVAPGAADPLATSSSPIPEPIRIVTPAGTVGSVGPVSTTKLYHGRHNVQSLIGFIQQLEQHSGTTSEGSINVLPYQTIKTKMERKAFEHLKMPKIVAYFENEMVPEFGTFVEAATELMADFPVYVVFDPVLAQKLRLKLPGQIALVRRLEKSTIYCPGTGVAVSEPTDGANVTANIGSVDSVTAADIVAWASGNRGLIHLLDDHNLYDPEVHDRSKYQLVAIGDRHTPIGMYLYKMVTKTIQNISRDNELKLQAILTQESPVSPEDTSEEFPTTVAPPTETTEAPPSPLPPIKLDDIEIVWIDLNKFPNIRSKLLSSVSNNNLDVWFGLVQVPESKAAQDIPESISFTEIWFDIASLNLTGSDKKADESNIQLLRTWILQVTDRPEPIPVPMVTEPDPIRIEIPNTKPDQQDKEIDEILQNQPESTIPEQKSKSKDRKDTKKVPTNSEKTEL